MGRHTLVLAVALSLLPLSLASAGEPWEGEPAFKTLVKQEIKTLQGLLKTALKKEYRRQAWYLADRITRVEPGNSKAVDVMNQWTSKELQLGQEPNKSFRKKRDSDLRELGDAYFHFGETLDASGMDRKKYLPLDVRAAAYGSRAGPLMAAFEESGDVWLGAFGPRPKSEVDELLGDDLSQYAFPLEYDDGYLKARAVWPASRGVMWSRWRLMSDLDAKEALSLLGRLAAAEQWFVERLGSNARKKGMPTTDLLVFSDPKDYENVRKDLVTVRRKSRDYEDPTGWYDRLHDILLVTWRHRDNPWLGDGDLVLGHAAGVMVRMHLSAGQGLPPRGRGYWLYEGLKGAFEGFRVDADGNGFIDPSACWLLAAARALREQGRLVPWDDFMDIDFGKAEAIPKATLQVQYGGAQREAKEVDIVAAQATAFVVGVMKHEHGKLLKRFSELVADLYKRDSLPDVDKALKLRRGKAVTFADVAMDAAH